MRWWWCRLWSCRWALALALQASMASSSTSTSSSTRPKTTPSPSHTNPTITAPEDEDAALARAIAESEKEERERQRKQQQQQVIKASKLLVNKCTHLLKLDIELSLNASIWRQKSGSDHFRIMWKKLFFVHPVLSSTDFKMLNLSACQWQWVTTRRWYWNAGRIRLYIKLSKSSRNAILKSFYI